MTKRTRADSSAGPRPTALSKHSLVIAGHRTSISLERAFWERLQAIARERQVSIASLVATIDAARGEANLSSALRVFVLSAAAGSPALTETKAPCGEQGR